MYLSIVYRCSGENSSSAHSLKCTCPPETPASPFSPPSSHHLTSSLQHQPVSVPAPRGYRAGGHTYLSKWEKRATAVAKTTGSVTAEAAALGAGEAAALRVAEAATPAAAEATAACSAAAAARCVVVLAPGVVCGGGGHGRLAGIGPAGEAGWHYRRGLVAGAVFARDSVKIVRHALGFGGESVQFCGSCLFCRWCVWWWRW